MIAVAADARIVPCFISGSDRPRKWLWRQRACGFRSARRGPGGNWPGRTTRSQPGRALYQRVGDGVMREIAALKAGQRTTASRGAA